MENEVLENEVMETKRVFTKIGLALFTMILSVIVVQTIMVGSIKKLIPTFEQSPWYNWILVGVGFYCIGFPIFALMVKGIPSVSSKERKSLSFGRMISLFFICMVVTYMFNIVGMLINTIIGLVKGSDVINPLEAVVNASTIIPTFIFVGILSPIVEEVLFRGILLDKLRVYGDKMAIWITALTFALFHGNLSQFFYAFALGLIFAYIAVKTNTIKYTVILHIIINILGSVIMPTLALSNNNVLAGVAGIIVIIIFIVGITLLITNSKKAKLGWRELDNCEVEKRVIYGNIGMIGYYIVCLYLFISTILA